MTQPRKIAPISVAIPVKDRLQALRATIASILEQTVLPFEIIIVDDASEIPLTPERLGYYSIDVQIRIIRNDVNRGGAASLNLAVSRALCNIVAFLDSDDCYMPRYIELISDRWQSDNRPKSLLAVGFFWCTDELVPYRRQVCTGDITKEQLIRFGNIVGGSSVMSVDRQAYLSCGGRPDIRGSHDWGLLLRISEIAPIETLGEPLVLYRSPTTSGLENVTAAPRKQILALGRLMRTLSPDDYAAIRPRIRRLVARHLALASRRRLSWRILLGTFRSDHLLDGALLKTSLINVVGAMRYRRTLAIAAKLRARIKI